MPKKMDTHQKDKVVDSWISATRAGGSSPIYEENWWAIEALMKLPGDDPELAWELMLMVLERENDKKVLGVLAAGPFEDLMCNYGQQLIERIEEESKTNKKLVPLMQGVRLSSEDTPIWERFYELADIEPPFPADFRPVEEYELKSKNEK